MQALGILRENAEEPEVVEYLNAPLGQAARRATAAAGLGRANKWRDDVTTPLRRANQNQASANHQSTPQT